MFQGQLLMCSGVPVYSPWFPRGGDNLRATVELIASYNSSSNITVSVLTKNAEETTDGTAIGSTFASSGGTAGRYAGEFTAGATALKEMVRYKFDPGTVTSGWVLFRMLPPVWFDSVR